MDKNVSVCGRLKSKGKCWFWVGDSSRFWEDKVKCFVEKEANPNILVFNINPGFKQRVHSTEVAFTIQNYMTHKCRKLKMFKNFQTSVLNTKDHFLSLHLCLARASKQANNAPVTLSDVLQCHRKYLQSTSNVLTLSNVTYENCIRLYKDFLKLSNAVDEWVIKSMIEDTMRGNLLTKDLIDLDILIIGTSINTAHVGILQCICQDKEIYHINLEAPLDASFSDCETNIETCFKIKTVEFNEIFSILTASHSKFNLSHPAVSYTEVYVKEMYRAFLGLLVNNRNELALARALTSPLIKMDHEGFTALKHLACERKMPMCQTAVSYVTRLQLGGKTYAPLLNCTLKNHTKQLTDFVTILNGLQDILEDDVDWRVCIRKIVNRLKMSFLNCGSLKKNSIQAVAEYIQTLASDLMESLIIESDSETSNMIGFKTLLLIRKIEDYLCTNENYNDDLSALTKDDIQQQGTPINVPSVLTFFRTPDLGDHDCVPSLRDRVEDKILVPIGEQKLLAGLPWGDVDLPPAPVRALSPVFERGCDIVEAISPQHESQTPKRKHFGELTKRSILSNISNLKNDNKRAKKNIKKKPQIKGQLQLTKFFGTQKSSN